MLLLSSLVLIVSYLFIAWERIPKVTVAMLGASLMLLFDHAPAEKVFSHIDFQVIFLLIGMMIIVNITNRSGVFKWLAIHMLRLTRGHPKLILVALATFTAVLSAFLDNVTTVVLVLPITFLVVKELELDAMPFLITEILSSNIGGTATLIGDPPNIIIGTAAGLSFMDFVRELAPVVILIYLVSIVLLVLIFRNQLRPSLMMKEKVQRLDTANVIRNPVLMVKSLAVLAAVITGFIFHGIIHIDAYILALLGASILLLFEKPKHVMHEVEWTTIFFFIGLFIIIGSFSEAGGVKWLAEKVIVLTAGDLKATTMLVLWASGVLSAVIDNIPYTVTMVPLINELKPVMDVTPLWWSLALGSCLGGNATIIGAAANVIVAESALSHGYRITFFHYLKYGLLITGVAFLMSTLYLYFRFF